jgi:hypothetical protein
MREQAEEFLAAGVAAIGGKTEETLRRNQRSLFDSLPRDVLEVEISASRAVGVMDERSGDPPGIKSQVACVASPGSQTDQGRKKITDATAT